MMMQGSAGSRQGLRLTALQGVTGIISASVSVAASPSTEASI